MEETLDALRAVAESTRLRIVVALNQCDLTVGELCRVLGQTQPRVSRHLKVLTDAGVLERHPQGTSAYFRPARGTQGRRILDAIVPLIEADAVQLERDRTRVLAIRQERAAVAAEFFAAVASDWDQMRDLHVSDAKVEQAMIDAVDDMAVQNLLDVGTGTGRVLEVFGSRIDRGVGVDPSGPMLTVARSRLEELGLRNCSVRQGDVYNLALDAGSFDVAVVHHVLHFLDDPATAITEVARTLGANGRLVIVDFASHSHERFRNEHAHHWLGFDDDEISEWCAEAGLVDVRVQHLRPRPKAGVETLTTTIWTATQHRDAPSVHSFDQHKAAS